MYTYLLVIASVITLCVLSNKLSNKIGIPTLLAFIVLGMFFGSDGFVKIYFDNYIVAQEICSVALIFIMFYGGFGTKWSHAKPVALKASLLSSVGVIITAGLVALFCMCVIKLGVIESCLMGAVISSTDAASVFSILRSKRLNLRYGAASLLEVESGSNDPFSYMLTIILVTILGSKITISDIMLMLVKQLFFGVVLGFASAYVAIVFLRRLRISESGFDGVFIIAVALVSYAASSALGGNGYLSVYITGIVIGNSKIENKQALVHFFDSTTGLMQMSLFFLLGLLSFPSQLLSIAPVAIMVALFLTFVARPVAVFAILKPFACSTKQCLLVSWAGMRGAASIVFAIMTVTTAGVTHNDIFHIVFFIVLFSILFQGSLIPLVAKLLDMTDDSDDVMKTFNDYAEEVPVQFIEFEIPQNHKWCERAIKDIEFPPDSLVVLLIRDGKKIIPRGNTTLMSGDVLVLGGLSSTDHTGINLYERRLDKGDEFIGKSIMELEVMQKLIVIILRGGETIIPTGRTVLMQDDVLVINDLNRV